MQRVKNISKLSFLLLMMVAGILAFSSTTQATNFKPYEYEFVVEDATTAERFNGIQGIKKLNITFDNAIPAGVDPYSDISVKATTETKGETSPTETLEIVKGVTFSTDRKTLSIHFKNLDYIDYTDTTKSYKLVIKSSAGLYVGQAEDLEFPFAIHDILPGFDSIFLVQGELGTEQIGTEQINRIFEKNPPRDIFVHIPKYYLNKIETIHRYKGVVTTAEASTLTNIDVLTDPVVTRLKVDLEEKLLRDLEPHPSVKGFTMGYANDQTLQVENLKEFTLKAYDSFGRTLDKTTFKINYINPASLGNDQIKVSDYIKKKASDFGKTYTLYDLMAKPKIFENILTGLSENDLNKIGITYANQISTVEVNNSEQFQLAIQNPKITTINLAHASDIVLANELIIDQDVSINGNDSTITGNVTLGKGTKDLRINLKDLDITGTLTVDVGTEGNAIAENVTVADTDVATSASVIIKSGGVNSIHLINFKAEEGIVFANMAPVRVVVSNPEELGNPNVTLSTNQEVILEGGVYGTVTSTTDDAKLTVRRSIKINGWSVDHDEGMKLTVTHPGTDSVKLPAETDGVFINRVETEPGEEDSAVGILTHTIDYESNGYIGPYSIVLRTDETIGHIEWEIETAVENVNFSKIDQTLEVSGPVEVSLLGKDEDGKNYKLTLTINIIN